MSRPKKRSRVSGIGTIAAARVIPKDAPPFIVVSMYARWTSPHPSTNRTGWIYSDSSAHRIISDLSAFIASTAPGTHRVLAAGDLNMIYGAKDDNRLALPARDRTVTYRMAALGMEFLGPRFPAGRRACHAATRLATGHPETVPTYHTTRQSPSTAQNQLDYAFTSRGFHKRVTVRALKSVEEWGASDHCRLLIADRGRIGGTTIVAATPPPAITKRASRSSGGPGGTSLNENLAPQRQPTLAPTSSEPLPQRHRRGYRQRQSVSNMVKRSSGFRRWNRTPSPNTRTTHS